jgi:nucleotide-binding universal stress UspA family protein
MANIGSSYLQNPPADQWDAIVIGSGIGGLAAAVLGRNLVSVVSKPGREVRRAA